MIPAVVGSAVGGAGAVMGLIPPAFTADYYAWANRFLKPSYMGLGDSLAAWVRKYIDDEALSWEGTSQGFSEERLNIYKKMQTQLLSGVELISLWRRAKISKPDLFARCEQLGFDEPTVNNLLDVTEIYPSAQDVIAFAVREVYSPEIAVAFGQYEGADEVISKAHADITASGMTEETFRKYWAAHWQLPGVKDGYEMLHRKVIEPDDLQRLMVALDIMPFWRDKLKAISYNPYTRVDVRRMHKLGILNDAQVLTAYMDLGYDDEKAGNMTAFTIAYNASPEAADLTEADVIKVRERDLTKADVLTGYRDALLEELEVREALAGLGYAEDEVDYYISRVDFNKERDETDTYLKYYHDAYIRGIFSYNDIVDKLGALDLSGKRMAYLFNIWDLEKTARVTKPTKAELLGFLRKGVIEKPECINELLGLGYSQKYTDWYMATV